MNTLGLTPTQLENLKEVASWKNGRFETKVAITILQNGYYSKKQADIVNVAIADFDNELPYENTLTFDEMQQRSRMNQRGSSLR